MNCVGLPLILDDIFVCISLTINEERTVQPPLDLTIPLIRCEVYLEQKQL